MNYDQGQDLAVAIPTRRMFTEVAIDRRLGKIVFFHERLDEHPLSLRRC
jgi:hypothetical protein